MTGCSATRELVESARLTREATKAAWRRAQLASQHSVALCDQSRRLIDTSRTAQRQKRRPKQAEPLDGPLGPSHHASGNVEGPVGTVAPGRGSPDHRRPDAPQSPKVILVVDDEPQVRSIMADLLRARGHDVAEAANGRLALDLIRRRPFDLVISDLRMPDLGGQGLYEQLGNFAGALLDRFIVVTGADDAGCEFFETQTRVPVIRKPFKLAELSEAVLRVLQRDSGSGPGTAAA
jgi:CheY-like chemotaxis protein